LGFIYFGVISKNSRIIFWGSLLTGLGFGVLVSVFSRPDLPVLGIIGGLLLGLALGFLSFFLLSFFLSRQASWWVLLPGFIFLSLGLDLIYFTTRLFDFILSLSFALFMGLILWGTAKKLIGLIIPACLILGAGLGTYLAWSTLLEENGLARSGIFLLSFGTSWLLVILSARLVLQKIIWWPYIPGGVLIVVGIGLFAGGNPGSALNLIGNAGSISFIVFGLYLLLLRNGINK
jgi:hypothetical protein